MATQGSTVVYVFGYLPGVTQDAFCSEFFEPFDMSYLVKIDFNPAKLFCFVHVQNQEQADELIAYWHGKIMNGCTKPLQVRMKGQSSWGGPIGAGGYKPKEALLFVYGFPPAMEQEQFEQAFFGEEFGDIWGNMEKLDFFPHKTMAFVKLGDFEGCEKLISHWNGRTMEGSDKPMQCRYKGQNSANPNQTATLFVYGYPKDMSEEAFREEFFLKFPGYEKRIDWHPHKLIAYVHLHALAQCEELIQHWNGNKFQSSEYPLQVRYFQQQQKQDGYGMGRGRGRGRGGYMGGRGGGAMGMMGYGMQGMGYGAMGGMGMGGMGMGGDMGMAGQMGVGQGYLNAGHPAGGGFQYFAQMPTPGAGNKRAAGGGAAGGAMNFAADGAGGDWGGAGAAGAGAGGMQQGGGKRAKMNPAMGGLNMGGSFGAQQGQW